MKVEIEISRDVLEDVFVTAIEGGSNYWYFLSDDAIERIRKAVPQSEDPYLSSAILKAILDHGVEVPINDVENEDDVIGTISATTMQERLSKLVQSSERYAIYNFVGGSGDANDADIVFQHLTMGEVVYG
jgi:hypothetical protein